jgi:hypothetical protein
MVNVPALLLKKSRSYVPVLNAAVNFAEGRFDQIKMGQGKILAQMNRSRTSTRLQDYEFKVFSQWGEDGIIQRLIDVVTLEDRTFIEFGVLSAVGCDIERAETGLRCHDKALVRARHPGHDHAHQPLFEVADW